VELNVETLSRKTLLWEVAHQGQIAYLRLLVASPCALDLSAACQEDLFGDLDGDGPFTVLEIARRQAEGDTLALLERYTLDPATTRHEVRLELGFQRSCAAELFALIVFLCEGLLEVHRLTLPSSRGDSFFRVAMQLPMELQMLLCHRTVASCLNHVLTEDSEPAFRSLAAILDSLKLAFL